MSSKISLKYGVQANIDSTEIEDGSMLMATDTENLYIDLNGNRIHINDRPTESNPLPISLGGTGGNNLPDVQARLGIKEPITYMLTTAENEVVLVGSNGLESSVPAKVVYQTETPTSEETLIWLKP